MRAFCRVANIAFTFVMMNYAAVAGRLVEVREWV